MGFRKSILVAAAALVPLAGCGDDPTGPRNLCTSDVSVTVSSGTNPTFTWEPACGMVMLQVIEEGTPDVFPRWWVLAESAGGIRPGIRYGTVPNGTAEFEPATPLRAGTTYRVVLDRSNQVGVEIIAGSATFTP